jgi:hypothetical protein
MFLEKENNSFYERYVYAAEHLNILLRQTTREP